MAEQICRTCGFRGKPKKLVKGRFLIEVVLWFCFLIPGLIYTLWRATSGTEWVCPSCGNPGMIPLNSPVGQQLAAQHPVTPHKSPMSRGHRVAWVRQGIDGRGVSVISPP